MTGQYLMPHKYHLALHFCLVQSERVFLLFSFKLVQFSFNFFCLDANFFGIWPFLVFWERPLNQQVFSSGKSALSTFWQEGFSFPRLAPRNLHLFLLKMLFIVTTAVALPVFAVLIAISSAFNVSLTAVLATLIGWGLWYKLRVPKGSSILRLLSTLNPVSPYLVPYSLLGLSQES